MADAVIPIDDSMARTSIRKLLQASLIGVVALHALQLILWRHGPVLESRLLTAAVPALAAACSLWRAKQLPRRERVAWRWLANSLVLWTAGQVTEALLEQSAAASNLTVDASDFFYVTAAFPLLLAVSSTKETEAIPAVDRLHYGLVIIALVLAWVRLFRMPMPAAEGATVMMRIYACECGLLALATLMRLVTWASHEERRRVGLLCRVVWIYLPIELGMDYASKNWGLTAGTLLDLLWSVPFVYAGLRLLFMPIGDAARVNDAVGTEPIARSSGNPLLESLCPLLFTGGVFALAASIASQHGTLALVSIFLLLVFQSVHASLMQAGYLAGQRLLLDRENELKTANTALEKLSMLDGLTGIANRRRFTSMLDLAWNHALRTRESLALLMIDVDFFKGVNDLHGHAYGDNCLKSVAQVLRMHAGRGTDLVARYGGEEFVVLLPDTNEAGARIVAERIRVAVKDLKILNEASPFSWTLTVSAGIAAGVPRQGAHPSELLERADQALYDAKNLGKDRICWRA